MNASGAARLDIDIVDYSILVDTQLKGRIAVPGVTERGKISKVYNINTWDDYQIELGGLMAGNDFPLYCKRALEAGAPLAIVPIGKYTDPSNPATLSGVVASYALTQAAVSAAGATVGVTMSAPTVTSSSTVSFFVKRRGQSDLVIADSVALTNSSTLSSAVTAIAAAINAGTGTHGYMAAANTTSGLITITAPAVLGAWGNTLQLSILAGQGIIFDAFIKTFSGGVDTTTTAGTIVVSALTKGAIYNGVQLVFAAAASNDPNKYDITVRLPNSKAPDELITDVPKLASDAAFAVKTGDLVANSRLISSFTTSSGFVMQPGTYMFANGTDGVAPVASDYMGDRGAQTNIYAFDNSSDVNKIAILALADPILAKQVADYVDEREDMMGLHRIPLGITPQRGLDYRYGTGSYNHTPIDSWRNLMFSGEISVTDPRTGLTRDIHPIGDELGNFANKDVNYHEWFSFAGEERGVLNNVLALHPNLGSKGNKTIAGQYDFAGIIPVVQNSKKVYYIAGDNTLYRKETLLKKSNVAELLIFLYRSLNELIPQNFDPNDVETWKGFYRKVQPLLEYIKTNRGIFAYDYKGDQDIMDISQAKINKPENIDAGQYKAIIGIKPKVNLKYIDFTIGVANSGANFDDVSVRG